MKEQHGGTEVLSPKRKVARKDPTKLVQEPKKVGAASPKEKVVIEDMEEETIIIEKKQLEDLQDLLVKTGQEKEELNATTTKLNEHLDEINVRLKLAEKEGSVDVWIRVSGGGTTGQVGAIVLGVARALQAIDESLHHKLADAGYLTRDSRMVERKKYGFKKARKSFQFSKR